MPGLSWTPGGDGGRLARTKQTNHRFAPAATPTSRDKGGHPNQPLCPPPLPLPAQFLFALSDRKRCFRALCTHLTYHYHAFSHEISSRKDLQHFCHDRGFGIWMVPADVIPEAPQKVKTDQGFDPHRAAEAEQSRGGAIGEWGGASQFPQRDQFSPLGFGSGKRGKEESLLTPEDVRKYRADFERLFAQE
ncbi:unnamed protein product [Scytosiphon promiscuus]